MSLDISTYVAASCTTSSIAGLGLMINPRNALRDLCMKELVMVEGPYSRSSSKYRILVPFYVFTAGPEVPGFGHSKPWVRYGTEFAAYLREHNLGEVATVNMKHHPKTTCQVWIWSPDQKAVEKWWEEIGNKPSSRKHKEE
jgi:hypothetical protein